MKISKEFKFEMAHKLENSYTCKCQNLHGHSYKAFVELSGRIGKGGVVTDFTLVKEEIGFVFDWLDHSIMLKDFDTVTTILKPLASADILKKVFVTNREPTAENIALWVFAVINDFLLSNFSLEGVKLESVTIHETATSKAIITVEDFSKETPMEVTFFNVTDETLKETPLYRKAHLTRNINFKQDVLKSVDSFAEKFSLDLYAFLKL